LTASKGSNGGRRRKKKSTNALKMLLITKKKHVRSLSKRKIDRSLNWKKKRNRFRTS
jgi:hypothetical protein